jgi:hypothetical protein
MDYSTVVDFSISFDNFDNVDDVLEKVSELKQVFIENYETFQFQLLIKGNEVEGKDCGPYFDEFIGYIKDHVSMDEDGYLTMPSPNPYDYPDRPDLENLAHYGEGDLREFTESFSFNDERIAIFVNVRGWFVSELDGGFTHYTDISHMIMDEEWEYSEY